MRYLVILMICMGHWQAVLAGNDLTFGQVYGSAGYASPEPSGTMSDGANVVLVFTGSHGHRSLVSTRENGDYVILLEPDRYCLTAYFRTGKPISLVKNQLKCVAVGSGKEVRLDVMLLAGTPP